jgi:hypothetical protein
MLKHFFLLKKVRAFLLPVQRIGNKVKLKFSLGQTWWISLGGWKVIIYDYGMEEGIGDQGEGDQGGRGQEGRMRGGTDSTRRGTRLGESIGGSGRKGTRRKDERGERSG